MTWQQISRRPVASARNQEVRQRTDWERAGRRPEAAASRKEHPWNQKNGNPPSQKTKQATEERSARQQERRKRHGHKPGLRCTGCGSHMRMKPDPKPCRKCKEKKIAALWESVPGCTAGKDLRQGDVATASSLQLQERRSQGPLGATGCKRSRSHSRKAVRKEAAAKTEKRCDNTKRSRSRCRLSRSRGSRSHSVGSDGDYSYYSEEDSPERPRAAGRGETETRGGRATPSVSMEVPVTQQPDLRWKQAQLAVATLVKWTGTQQKVPPEVALAVGTQENLFR